jgi:hypothetical protein
MVSPHLSGIAKEADYRPLSQFAGKLIRRYSTTAVGMANPCASTRMKRFIRKWKKRYRCEQNHLLKIADYPNDPDFDSKQWALRDAPAAGIRMASAWQMAAGPASPVYVGVIDTGVDLNHPDLTSNLWNNAMEIDGNGIDDDLNGVIDDIHGINAIDGSGTVTDDNGHGTHVTGIVGATINNGMGIAGIAPHVRVISCKFLGASGIGSTADAIKALAYLRELKTREVDPLNIVASNNSWLTSFASVALQEEIERQSAARILFVSSAGNNGVDLGTQKLYPVNFGIENIVRVAAVDIDGNLASFSNYSPEVVDIAAPGVSIYSTYLGGTYLELSGTSMAAPHVSGVAALLAARNPGLSALDLKSRILTGAAVRSTLTGVVAGGRLLDAPGALSAESGGTIPIPQISTPQDLSGSYSLNARSSGGDQILVPARGFKLIVRSQRQEAARRLALRFSIAGEICGGEIKFRFPKDRQRLVLHGRLPRNWSGTLPATIEFLLANRFGAQLSLNTSVENGSSVTQNGTTTALCNSIMRSIRPQKPDGSR